MSARTKADPAAADEAGGHRRHPAMRRLSLSRCQKRLAILWFAGATPTLLVVFVQTLRDVYGERTQEVWAWLLPTLLPTLLLMMGVVAADAIRRPERHAVSVDRFSYRLTAALSLAYLLLVNLVFFLRPFSELAPLALLQRASLLLGPLQGLVAAALGVFFTARPKPEHG